MRIAILSPLFPPDVAIPAPYVKELALRLSKEHTVTILTYSHIPEAVPGAKILSIEKQQLLPQRLFHFFRTLLATSKANDILLVQNGISTELPVLVRSFFSNTPFILEISDPKAVLQNEHSRLKRTIHHLLARKAVARISHDTYHNLLSKPEIISFEPFPQVAMDTYETTWQMHLDTLKQNFSTYAK